jgi:hypothetical protein
MLLNPSGETSSDQIEAEDLVRAYALLAPLAHLQFPPALPGAFTRVHDALLNEILLDPHLRAYPPATEYQLKFWKWAVQGLEALLGDEVSLQVLYRAAPHDSAIVQDSEIDVRIYDRLMELIQSAPNSQPPTEDLTLPSPSYVTHYLRLYPDTPNVTRRVTLLESRAIIEQGTTGLKTWPAAHVLAEWLGKHPGLVQSFTSRSQGV